MTINIKKFPNEKKSIFIFRNEKINKESIPNVYIYF